MKKILIILLGICLISCNDRVNYTLIIRKTIQYSDNTYCFVIYSYDDSGYKYEEYDYYSKNEIFHVGDTLKLVKK